MSLFISFPNVRKTFQRLFPSSRQTIKSIKNNKTFLEWITQARNCYLEIMGKSSQMSFLLHRRINTSFLTQLEDKFGHLVLGAAFADYIASHVLTLMTPRKCVEQSLYELCIESTLFLESSLRIELQKALYEAVSDIITMTNVAEESVFCISHVQPSLTKLDEYVFTPSLLTVLTNLPVYQIQEYSAAILSLEQARHVLETCSHAIQAREIFDKSSSYIWLNEFFIHILANALIAQGFAPLSTNQKPPENLDKILNHHQQLSQQETTKPQRLCTSFPDIQFFVNLQQSVSTCCELLDSFSIHIPGSTPIFPLIHVQRNIGTHFNKTKLYFLRT